MTEAILLIPPVPDGLREAAQLGVLVPFVGAGASRLAGRFGVTSARSNYFENIITFIQRPLINAVAEGINRIIILYRRDEETTR